MKHINWKIPLRCDSATDCSGEDLEMKSCVAKELFIPPNGVLFIPLLCTTSYAVYDILLDTRYEGERE